MHVYAQTFGRDGLTPNPYLCCALMTLLCIWRPKYDSNVC
jgi:hypothetical protein